MTNNKPEDPEELPEGSLLLNIAKIILLVIVLVGA